MRMPEQAFPGPGMMKYWGKKLALAGVAGLVGLALGVWWMCHEPTFHGKRMAEWAAIFDRAAKTDMNGAECAECRQAAAAIRAMAPYAVPYALHLVRGEQPAWKDWVRIRLERTRWRAWAMRRFMRSAYDHEPNPMGPVYFRMLGPAGSSAIPELKRILREAIHPLAQMNAAQCLAYAGPEGIQELLRILAVGPLPIEYGKVLGAWDSLRWDPALAREAFPLAAAAAATPHDPLYAVGLQTVGMLHLEPEKSIRLLALGAARNDVPGQSFARHALDEWEYPVLPVLTNLLAHPEADVRAAATNALQLLAGKRS